MLTAAQVEDAVVLTFEEMAFLDVVPGPPPEPAPPEEGPWLLLTYSSPRAGAFALFLPKVVRFAVAEAIYGDSEQDLSAVQLDDSLLELMNVLGGKLLSRRFGPSASYAMGLPSLLYDPPPEPDHAARRDYPFHRDEAGLLLVWYEVQP